MIPLVRVERKKYQQKRERNHDDGAKANHHIASNLVRKISNCKNKQSITQDDEYSGGLLSHIKSQLINCGKRG